jgi:hypothetical protein
MGCTLYSPDAGAAALRPESVPFCRLNFQPDVAGD